MRAVVRDLRNIVRDFFGDIGRRKHHDGGALRRVARDISGFSPSGWRGGDGSVITRSGEDYHRSFDEE